eukprot:INCI9392.1.p1 GENE.INCI9392.1~~INCI9392.1.p1  ORF type:complete len:674 (+),score=142.10 INCI9392.1:208-2229(+)
MALQLNQRVLVRGTHPGTVRFIGTVSYAKGEFVGVELDEAVGKNDGQVKGVRYFTCPKNHGLLARPYDVEEAPPAEGLPAPAGADTHGSSDSDDDAPSLRQSTSSAPDLPAQQRHGHSHGGQPCHGHGHGQGHAHVHPNSPAKKSADEIRAMGNDYFGRKDYKTALAFYNRSVQLSDRSTKHLSLGNRAITKINLKDYNGAIADCDEALALQPNYVKCYTRKGMAFRHMNRLEEAFAALEEGMKYAPHDAGIQKEMSRVIKSMEKQMKELQGGAGMGGFGDVDMSAGGMPFGGDMGGMMGMGAPPGAEKKKKPVRVNKSLIGPLQDATRRNDIDEVKRLLAGGDVDVNSKDGHDMVALEWAAKSGLADMVAVLLEHKAAVDPVDEEAGSAVLSAAAGGHLEILKALLQAGGSIRVQDSILGHSALHRACDGGRPSVVDYLLGECPELLAQPDSRGYTPLAVAASKGHFDIVRRLLEAKADLATTAKSGSGPLALAVKASHAPIVQHLLDSADADGGPGRKTVVDGRVIYNAIVHAEDDVLALIEPMAEGAPPDCKGRTPLHLAGQERSDVGVEYMLQSKWARSVLDARDAEGETAVLTATRRGAFSVLKLLVTAKADVNVAEPEKGRTPLHIAGLESMDPVYEYLLRHGANTNARDKNGDVPELKEKKNCIVM